jgi:serine/threonine-protein kinase
LKGRFYWNQRTAPALLQAVGFFRRALEIDPNYARAYAGLAATYGLLPSTGGMPPRAAAPLARQAAKRALELDSTLADAHVSLGIVELFADWEPEAAGREFERALVIDSNSADAYLFRAWSLTVRGRLSEASASLEHARSLDPLSLIINARIAQMLCYQKRYAEAELAARRALQINPAFVIARLQLALALARLGKMDDAIGALPAPGTLPFGSQDAGIAGAVFAWAGQPERARQEIRFLTDRPYVAADAVAAIYTALGDNDQAIQWLERSFDARDIGLVFITVDPMFDPLRHDPRFTAILGRMGLLQKQR